MTGNGPQCLVMKNEKGCDAFFLGKLCAELPESLKKLRVHRCSSRGNHRRHPFAEWIRRRRIGLRLFWVIRYLGTDSLQNFPPLVRHIERGILRAFDLKIS